MKPDGRSRCVFRFFEVFNTVTLFHAVNSASFHNGQAASFSERIGFFIGQSIARPGSSHLIARS